MVDIIWTQLTCSSPSRMLRRNNRSSLERSSPWWPLPLCEVGCRIASDSLVGSLSRCLCFMSAGPWKLCSLLCLGSCFRAEPSVSLLLERILWGLERRQFVTLNRSGIFNKGTYYCFNKSAVLYWQQRTALSDSQITVLFTSLFLKSIFKKMCSALIKATMSMSKQYLKFIYQTINLRVPLR